MKTCFNSHVTRAKWKKKYYHSFFYRIKMVRDFSPVSFRSFVVLSHSYSCIGCYNSWNKEANHCLNRKANKIRQNVYHMLANQLQWEYWNRLPLVTLSMEELWYSLHDCVKSYWLPWSIRLACSSTHTWYLGLVNRFFFCRIHWYQNLAYEARWVDSNFKRP